MQTVLLSASGKANRNLSGSALNLKNWLVQQSLFQLHRLYHLQTQNASQKDVEELLERIHNTQNPVEVELDEEQYIQQHIRYQRLRWGLLTAACGVSLLVYQQANSDNSIGYCQDVFSTSGRRRVFFNYEKRLRDMSSREKVFNYFASAERDGYKLMSPDDLLHALVAVHPPESAHWIRYGSLPGENRADLVILPKDYIDMQFFKELDLDGDGFLSFSEYLLILALVNVPDQEISTVFKVMDISGNGTISYNEFKVMLDHLKCKAGTKLSTAQAGNKMMGIKADAAHNSGLIRKFFGADLSQELDLKHFEDWLEKLQRQLVMLEFSYLDWNNNGKITGKDFARTIVSSATVLEVNVYLNQVEKMCVELSECDISLKEFCDFAEMRRYLPQLQTALEFYSGVRGFVKKEVFVSVVKLVAGVQLTENQVEIVFNLFGNAQGRLDFRSLVEVLEHRGGKRITDSWQKTQWEWSPSKLIRRIKGETEAVLYEFRQTHME